MYLKSKNFSFSNIFSFFFFLFRRKRSRPEKVEKHRTLEEGQKGAERVKRGVKGERLRGVRGRGKRVEGWGALVE